MKNIPLQCRVHLSSEKDMSLSIKGSDTKSRRTVQMGNAEAKHSGGESEELRLECFDLAAIRQKNNLFEAWNGKLHHTAPPFRTFLGFNQRTCGKVSIYCDETDP